jgi:hypothetical protein
MTDTLDHSERVASMPTQRWWVVEMGQILGRLPENKVLGIWDMIRVKHEVTPPIRWVER